MKLFKIKNILSKIILLLSLITPFLFSIFVTIKYGFQPYTNYRYKLVIVIVLLSIFIFIGLIKLIKRFSNNKYTDFLFISIIILFSLITRIISVKVIGSNYSQVSDFEIAYNSGVNHNYQNSMYAKNSHWALYPQLISLILTITKSENVATIQFFNCIISSLSCVILYLISKKNTKNNLIGLTTGILFATYLPNILYINILTPEHPAIFFILLGFLFYNESCYQKKIKYKIILFFVSSLFLAISNFFRPFSQILVIAIAIIGLINIIVSKNRKIILVLLLFFLISYKGLIELGFYYLEKSIGNNINRSFISTTMYIGLNRKCNGSWCPEVVNEIDQIIQDSNSNYKKISSILNEKIKNDLMENYKLFPKTLYNKIITTWSSDNHSIGWLLAGDTKKIDNAETTKFMKDTLSPILTINYLLIMILSLISGFFALFKKLNTKYIIPSLFLLGVFILFLITEAQPRYKSVAIPFIILFSTNQVQDIKNKLYTAFKKMF